MQEDQEGKNKCVYIYLPGAWSGKRSHGEQRLQINDYKFKLIKGFGNVIEFDCENPFWKSSKTIIHIFWNVIPLASQPTSSSQ